MTRRGRPAAPLALTARARAAPYGLCFRRQDNFWEMGDTGPCGPCSELHYDRIGGGRDASALVNQDDPNVLEIWNLVFMQFNREASGELRRLPACHVDTGMGFERLVSVLQDRLSNYDTDVFAPLFAHLQRDTGAPPYAGKLGDEDVGMRDTAYRVIADHIRTLSFAIADGALPSNEGRGYVLRRILRRAVRYGRQKLGAPDGFLARLAAPVADAFGDEFPELRNRLEHVQAVLDDEESSFGSMLARGIKEFERRTDALAEAGGDRVDGATAFFLYDSMGFPLDLTVLMAKEKGLRVDEAGFEAEMAAQRERSAAAAKAAKATDGGRSLALEVGETAELARAGVRPTDDSAKYEAADAPPLRGATVVAIFDGARFLGPADSADSSSGALALVLDRTSFYAESGGQVGDVGQIVPDAEGEAWRFEVSDTQAYAGYVVHVGRVVGGSFAVGARARAAVDAAVRRKVAPNHSMTHVLNLALRKQLGEGVEQRGSLCDAERLRFDFAHGASLTDAELRAVEETVAAVIAARRRVHAQSVPLNAARAVSAVRAVFGETYPDPVRLVSMGVPIDELLADPANAGWAETSIEFCGGTHVASTGDAQLFSIVEETGIAKGVRRITALTRDAAAAAVAEGRALEQQLAALRAADGGVPAREALVALRARVDGVTAPTVVKSAVRAECAVLEKAVAAKAKAEASARANAAVAAALAAAERAQASGAAYVVLPLGDGLDSKGVGAVVKAVSKAVPRLALLALASADGSLLCVSQVRARRACGPTCWVGEPRAPWPIVRAGAPLTVFLPAAGCLSAPAALRAARSTAARPTARAAPRATGAAGGRREERSQGDRLGARCRAARRRPGRWQAGGRAGAGSGGRDLARRCARSGR